MLALPHLADSGVSSIIFTPYTARELEGLNNTEEATGFSLALDWDNRDSTLQLQLKVLILTFKFTTGAESWSNDDLWLKWTFQKQSVFRIRGLGDLFDQQVVALDFYTADTPILGITVLGRIARVHLRQNKLDLVDCNDWEAILVGVTTGVLQFILAEYRVIPDWQPLGDIPFN